MTTKGLYAVAGVTGNTGSAAANTLLERGAGVRVIVREKSKGDAWAERGAEVAVADVDDSASLVEALRSTDGAYLLSPPDLMSEDMLATRKATVDSIADAIAASGIPHVVFLSSIGAHQPEGTGVIRSLRYAEQRIGALDVASTFIRASSFTENWAAVMQTVMSDGVLPTFYKADLAIDHVATVDIGRVAAEALLDGPKGKGSIIELGGPVVATPTDVAGILSDLLGRTITVSEVPHEAQVSTFQSFGFPEGVAKLFFEMNRGFESGQVCWENASKLVRGKTTIAEVLGKFTSH